MTSAFARYARRTKIQELEALCTQSAAPVGETEEARCERAERMIRGAIAPTASHVVICDASSKMTDEGMIVDLIVNEKNLKFVIDTAATLSGVKKSSVSRYQTGSCDNVLKDLGTHNCSAIDLLLAGNRKEHKISALLIDSDMGGLEADGIIGGNFLYSNRILMDFVRDEIYVSP